MSVDKTISLAREILSRIEVKVLTNQPLSKHDIKWLIESNDTALTLIKCQDNVMGEMKAQINKYALDLVLRGDEIAQLSPETQG